MKLEKELSRKIIRDGLISLFLYALPVLLMLLSFRISGEKPWLKKKEAVQNSTAIANPKK